MLHYVSYHYNRVKNKKWCVNEDGLSELTQLAHDSSTREENNRKQIFLFHILFNNFQL